MKTKNYFLLVALTAMLGLGCKKQIQEPTLMPQSNQSSMTTASQSIAYLPMISSSNQKLSEPNSIAKQT